MSALRWIYLGLSIIGSLLPMRYFWAWFSANGFDLGLMFAAWRVNDATSGLFWNVVIAAIALCVWILSETYVRKNWIALWAIPATFFIGVSSGLPLFLFLRSRPIT